jgi:hypothetical protein
MLSSKGVVMAEKQEIVQQIEKLSAYGKELCKQSANSTFDMNYQFIFVMGGCVISLAANIKKHIDQDNLSTETYIGLKNKAFTLSDLSISEYLSLETLLKKSKPKGSLVGQTFEMQIHDVFIGIFRAFFRIFDILFTAASGKEKTIAQENEDALLKLYKDNGAWKMTSAQKNELVNKASQLNYFNYSSNTLFFKIAKKMHKEDMTLIHQELESHIKTLDQMISA